MIVSIVNSTPDGKNLSEFLKSFLARKAKTRKSKSSRTSQNCIRNPYFNANFLCHKLKYAILNCESMLQITRGLGIFQI